MDSVPILAITGQVSSSLLGKDAFQESDIVGITLPITKMNYLVQNIEDLPRILKEAYYISSTGRPGPVLVDIPRDIQLQKITYQEFEKLYEKEFKLEGYDPTYKEHQGQIKRALKLIKEAKKLLIIAGAGILKSKASEYLREFAEKTDTPVTMTLLGLGAFPGSFEGDIPGYRHRRRLLILLRIRRIISSQRHGLDLEWPRLRLVELRLRHHIIH